MTYNNLPTNVFGSHVEEFIFDQDFDIARQIQPNGIESCNFPILEYKIQRNLRANAIKFSGVEATKFIDWACKAINKMSNAQNPPNNIQKRPTERYISICPKHKKWSPLS